MKDTYEKALRRTLVHEGGWSNHPKDPGGATMRGVTQRVYDGYRAAQKLAQQSVRNITDTELKAIYRELYADRVRFDELPAGIDAAVFDAAVNSGPAQAIKWLQRALGIKADGNIGPATITATRLHSAAKIIRAFSANRMTFLKRLGTWPTFRKGWQRRVEDIEAFALALASGTASSRAIPQDTQVTPRATIDQAKKRPSKQMGDLATGAGLGGGAVAGGLKEFKDTLTPLAGDGSWINTAIAVVAVLSLCAVVGGVLWRLYQQRKAKQQADDLDLPEQVVV